MARGEQPSRRHAARSRTLWPGDTWRGTRRDRTGERTLVLIKVGITLTAWFIVWIGGLGEQSAFLMKIRAGNHPLLLIIVVVVMVYPLSLVGGGHGWDGHW